MEQIIYEFLHLITNGIILTDPDEVDNPVIYVNKAFTDLTGYKPNEVIGKNLRLLQGENTSQEDSNKLSNAIKKRRPITIVIKNYKKNGEEFWNELYISPVTHKGKLYFVGIQQDVTSRINAQIKLEQYKERLELMVEERTKKLTESYSELLKEIEENKNAQKKILSLNEKLLLYGKKLEKKILSKEIKLTKNEKIIYELLTDAPNLTLTDINKQTSIPFSTISTVKKRLLVKKLDSLLVPNPNLFELITLVVYSDETPGILPEEAFFCVSGKDKGFYLMANKDWPTFYKTHKLTQLKGTRVHHFDCLNSKISLFGILNDVKKKIVRSQPKTLYGALKYEDAKQIANRTNVSLQTTSKNLKNLKDSKILNCVYFDKISLTENIVLSMYPNSFIGLEDETKSFGIEMTKISVLVDPDVFVIPISEAKIKLDFAGAVKKNYLSI